MPKSNSQQKSTRDTRTRRQQVGAERRGSGGIAEGKDWPEGPESSRGEIFLNCGRAREKLTGRNTARLFAKQRGWETPEKSRPNPAGGRRQGEGQGANSAPEKPPPPTRQTGPGSCLKTSWDPTGGARWGRGGRRQGAMRSPNLRGSLWWGRLNQAAKLGLSGRFWLFVANWGLDQWNDLYKIQHMQCSSRSFYVPAL